MPREYPPASGPAESLATCLAALDAREFSFAAPDDIAFAAAHLAALGRDRHFLGDAMLAILSGAAREEATSYGPQAIMLAPPRAGYFLRANIWPAADDRALRLSGADAFAYGIAHDHNFDFLTLGYFGPGYASDYYEYDYAQVAGVPGERAGLRFVERATLAPGRLLHYRAHRDVHAQWPPESLSVSINICAAGPAVGWHDQYRFDVGEGVVAGVLNRCASEALIRCGVALAHDGMRDLAVHFARHHPSDRLRLACYDARAAACGADDARADAVWREAELSGRRLVAASATARRRALADSG